MASITYKSDIIKTQETLEVSDKIANSGKKVARLLFATAEYVFKPSSDSTLEKATDVILLTDLPAGATVVPELSYVWKNFGGRQLKIELGDSADPDRFGVVDTSGISSGPCAFGYSTEGHAMFGNGAANVIPTYKEPTRLQARLAALNGSNSTGQKLKFGIAYRVQG